MINEKVIPAQLSLVTDANRVISEKVQPAQVSGVASATRVINEKVIPAQLSMVTDANRVISEKVQPGQINQPDGVVTTKPTPVIRQASGGINITIPMQVSFSHEKGLDENAILRKMRDAVRSEIERAAATAKARDRAKLYDRE